MSDNNQNEIKTQASKDTHRVMLKHTTRWVLDVEASSARDAITQVQSMLDEDTPEFYSSLDEWGFPEPYTIVGVSEIAKDE